MVNWDKEFWHALKNEEEAVKVVMLGHTGVGKTTYMASMYGVLQKPINGFSLRAQRDSHHSEFLKLFEKIITGQYPEPTDQRGEYGFHLTYGGEPFFPFTWVDYRGKAITESSETADTSQLLKDLGEADGIMIFCDCDALAHGRGRANQVGRMTVLVGKAVQAMQHTIPIAIVLTKADLVDELDDRLVGTLRGLIDTIAASQSVVGTILPVTCGREPENVHVPVLFVLYYGLLLLGQSMDATLQEHIGRKERYEAKSGIFDDVWSWFTGEDSYSDLAYREYQEARATWEKLQILLPPARELENYLEGLRTF